jgi:hypothetical protein
MRNILRGCLHGGRMGIFVSDFEQGEFGLEGPSLVSKHRDKPYHGRTAEALDQGQRTGSTRRSIG